MADRERIPLGQAEDLAAEIVGHLADCCERIEVAGSIRRRRPTVADVEIVAIPKTETRSAQADLFTTREETVDLLHLNCFGLRLDGVFSDRLDVNGRPAFGPKFKRLLYRDFPLDLFVTTPDCWGCIFLIRTGPAEFGKQLVLRESLGGWLPRGFFFRDGRLWKLPPPYGAEQHAQAAPLDTPEEWDVFRELGYAYLPPWERSDRRPPVLGR